MKNYLKTIVNEKGLSILTDPLSVCSLLKDKVEQDSSYPFQMELLLKTVNIGEMVQEPDKLKQSGRAAYNAMIMRAVKKTGFTVELTKELMNHVVASAGICMEDIYQINIQNLKKEALLSEDFQGEVRGREAYESAKLLLQGDQGKSYISRDTVNAAAQKQAVTMLKIAAADGCNVAYGLLAICYFNGIGVKKDYEEAYRCILMPEALTGDFLDQKRDIVGKLYAMSHDIKKKKAFTLIFEIVTLVMTVMVIIAADAPFFGFLLFAASAVNLLVSIYQLITKKCTLLCIEKYSAISAVLWCLAFLLCI